MIDFGYSYDDDMPVPSEDYDKKDKHYPKLYVRGVKSDDGLEGGEVTKVMAKVKKCQMTERYEDGETVYDCEYEIHGFEPCPMEKPRGMRMRGADFLDEIE